MLIIVTGLPATGKTTVAKRLSSELKLPLYSKDAYKELLFDTLGVKDRGWSRSLGVASIELLYADLTRNLEAEKSCIIESNFMPKFDNERLTRLLYAHPTSCVQILCKAEGETVVGRFEQRVKDGSRHAGHNDHETIKTLRASLLEGRAEPLNIPCRLIEVDTTSFDKVNIASLAKEISEMKMASLPL
jgi:predicted kinase